MASEVFLVVVSTVFGVAFSLFVELVPGAAGWWAALTGEYKKFYRAIGGAVVVLGLALLHFLAGVDFGLGAEFDVYAVLAIIASWASFALVGAEGAYQFVGPFLERKR